MKYAEELEKAGLHKAVSCIVRQFPHLEKLAENDARSFAEDCLSFNYGTRYYFEGLLEIKWYRTWKDT